MTLNEIAVLRLNNQLLSSAKFFSPAEVVFHFGAMQAQDYAMAKWAVGVRLPNTTDALIDAAVSSGEIIRTHILRPTWHFLAAADIHWMLELTSANVRRQMASYNSRLGFDEITLGRSNEIIYRALEGGKHLTREEIMKLMVEAGINTEGHRSLHLMMNAELSGIVCSGAKKGKLHTYGILDERVKKTKNFSRDESLRELAKRYFTSHGPATLKDFIWWSGLSVAESKKAIAFNESNFDHFKIDGQKYWLVPSQKQEPKSVHLLPAFDEYLISYKDRSAAITKDFSKFAFTSNGIFRPVIVVDGRVIGTWKRTAKKDVLHIETNFFQKPSKTAMLKIEEAISKYSKFMEIQNKTR